jgi:uncharacterized protein YbcV (DUF1398 family)
MLSLWWNGFPPLSNHGDTMSTQTHTVLTALQHAADIRPKVGGFPVLAEVLRQAGVRRNEWTLPAGQSVYITDTAAVVDAAPGPAPLSDMTDVAAFDRDAVIYALRADQSGHTSFPEFLTALWTAGVTRFTVDLHDRTVTYSGPHGDAYLESYPAVEITQTTTPSS